MIIKNWIAIVDMDQPGIRRPLVIGDIDTEEAATFSSPEEIGELYRRHLLGCFDWWAFNYVTGESQVVE
jgi:hypothetical protein